VATAVALFRPFAALALFALIAFGYMVPGIIAELPQRRRGR
jgi:hypothetical protein